VNASLTLYPEQREDGYKFETPGARINLDRLRKDNQQLEKVILSTATQLGNETFMSKAPAKVTEGMRAKLAEYEAQYRKNKEALGE